MKEDASFKYAQLVEYFNRIEEEIHTVFDPVIFNNMMRGKFN